MITLTRIHEPGMPIDRPIYRVESDGALLFEAHQGQDPECWNFRTEETDDWTVHVCSLPAFLQGIYEMWIAQLLPDSTLIHWKPE